MKSLLFTCLLLSIFINVDAQSNSKKYYAVIGLVNGNSCSQLKSKIIGNVVSADCEFTSIGLVQNQFAEYYKAFVGPKNCYMNSAWALEYDTWDEAEKTRRELIAAAKSQDEVGPILVYDFRVLCKD